MGKYRTGFEHEYLPEIQEQDLERGEPHEQEEPSIIRHITGIEADEPYPDIPVPNQVVVDEEHEIIVGHEDQSDGSPRGTRIRISPWKPSPEIDDQPEAENDFGAQLEKDLEQTTRKFKPRIP